MEEQLRLDLLDPEVLAMICEYVDDTSPTTTISLALTCKYLASVVKLITHRHKTLQIKAAAFDFQSLPVIIQKWSEDQSILVHMRSLTVDGNLPRYPDFEPMLENDELWQPLIELIPKIARLRLLIWNLPAIPIKVLDAFHTHHPTAKLRLFKYQPSVDAEPSKRDKALAKSPALTHLRSVLRPLSTNGNHNMQETAFRRIVKLAPLEYASIVNHIGDPVAGEPHRKLPFNTTKKPNSSIRVLTLDGYNMSKATLEDWSSTVDLAGLENVKCSRGLPELSYFESAPSMLPNLKHVSLNFRQIAERLQTDTVLIETIQHYLKTCPPLASLSLWSWASVVNLDDILQRHGPTLKSLQLHERETSVLDNLREILTVSQLKNILTSCPQLKDLTIDLDRGEFELELNNNDKNLAYFELLRNSKLDHLQIYFDVGLLFIHNQTQIDSDDAEEGDDYEEETVDGEGEEDQQEDASHDGESAGISNNDRHEGKDDSCGGMKRQADQTHAEPSTKRRKRSPSLKKPSTEDNMRSYVEDIWKTVFSDSLSARKLDVKFGEWESIRGRRAVSWTWMNDDEFLSARFFMARPAERDDEPGKCTITMMKM